MFLSFFFFLIIVYETYELPDDKHLTYLTLIFVTDDEVLKFKGIFYETSSTPILHICIHPSYNITTYFFKIHTTRYLVDITFFSNK